MASSKHSATMCDVCKANKAVVHVTQITEVMIKTSHFCKDCAANKGITQPEKSIKASLYDFLNEIGEESSRSPISTQHACSFCNMKVKEFQRTGRLGCSQCYTDFYTYLKKVLKRIHGSSLHVGKVYLPPDPSAHQLAKRLEFLRSGMSRAVQKEEFEKAALIRDEITKMQSADEIGG